MTPSVPIEITFGAQPIATGRKVTTLLGHRAATGGTGVSYQSYEVVNVGDPVAAKAEVDGIAGSGSQLGKMAEAFVSANSKAGRSNFPAFRIVLIPSAVTDFGPADEALEAIKFLRSDLIVSCYPASASTLRTKVLDLVSLISGVDRDLTGQFGSFACFGSLDVLATAIAYNVNSRYGVVAYLQDTNTALIEDVACDVLNASKILSNVASIAGINEGAQVSGVGIPAGAVVTKVNATTVEISLAATATGTAVLLDFQNVVSQPVEIVAAAHAAGMMQSVFPYNPLQSVAIGGLLPPKKRSDWIAIDPAGASEQALTNGLSPLTILPGNIVGFIRTRTTYTTLPGSIAVTAYFDWQDLVILNDFRESCYQVCQLPPFNNNPGGTKASLQIAALLKDEILRVAQGFEDAGGFQGVKTNAKLFVVENSSTMRGRFDFKIPVNVIPGLFVIAGNIQAVSGEAFGDFTL